MEKGRGAEGGQLLLGAAQEQGAGEQIHRQVPPLDVQQARGDVQQGSESGFRPGQVPLVHEPAGEEG